MRWPLWPSSACPIAAAEHDQEGGHSAGGQSEQPVTAEALNRRMARPGCATVDNGLLPTTRGLVLWAATYSM